MSFGEMMFAGGVTMMLSGIAILIIGSVRYSMRKKALKKKLYDRYGF